MSMLMKKRDLSCKSHTVKISSGEVNSHCAGCSLVYSAALLCQEKKKREPGLARKWPCNQVQGMSTYGFSGNKNLKCWNCISWDYMGSPPYASARGCGQTGPGDSCPLDVTLNGCLCACICHSLLVQGQHFYSFAIFCFLVQVKKCLSVVNHWLWPIFSLCLPRTVPLCHPAPLPAKAISVLKLILRSCLWVLNKNVRALPWE